MAFCNEPKKTNSNGTSNKSSKEVLIGNIYVNISLRQTSPYIYTRYIYNKMTII